MQQKRHILDFRGGDKNVGTKPPRLFCQWESLDCGIRISSSQRWNRKPKEDSMRTQKRLLITLATFAAAGLVGCLNSPEPAQTASIPVSESEIQAALSGDSMKPVRPAVCDTLKARLALLDSTAPEFAGLTVAVARVCSIRPHRPDSLRSDSLRPRPDSLRPQPPKPVKPDSLRPQPPKPVKPDSLRADSLRPRPDSLRPQPPKPPKPPKRK